MKRSPTALLILLLVSIGVCALVWLQVVRSGSDESSPPPEAKTPLADSGLRPDAGAPPHSIRAPDPDSRAAMRSMKVQAQPAHADGAAPGAPRHDPRMVEFTVTPDGLAVAFGDVLLGKADGGNAGDHGLHEPSPPRTWEKPEIPYLISPALPDPKRVERALEYISSQTPVKFIPFNGQPDMLSFEVGTDQCLSFVGKQGGIQPIKLADGCQTPEILHEILHALGFIHEHSRTDRDQYVQIAWSNINEKYVSQFDVVPESWMETVRASPFDYHSIMLYAPTTFARQPGAVVLSSRQPGESVSPVKEGLSEGDLKRIRKLYEFW